MRTTVSLDDDVVAHLEGLRRERGLGLSAAINELVRQGFATAGSDRAPYRHRAVELGLKLDVTDVAQVLEHLDES